MSTDEKTIAKEYLKNNNISKLLSRLTALLVLHKPDNPREFIVQTLKNKPNLEELPLLDDKELETMFQMLANPVYKDEIKGNKIISTLAAMGIQCDAIDSNSTVNLQQFKEIMKSTTKEY